MFCNMCASFVLFVCPICCKSFCLCSGSASASALIRTCNKKNAIVAPSFSRIRVHISQAQYPASPYCVLLFASFFASASASASAFPSAFADARNDYRRELYLPLLLLLSCLLLLLLLLLLVLLLLVLLLLRRWSSRRKSLQQPGDSHRTCRLCGDAAMPRRRRLR